MRTAMVDYSGARHCHDVMDTSTTAGQSSLSSGRQQRASAGSRAAPRLNCRDRWEGSYKQRLQDNSGSVDSQPLALPWNACSGGSDVGGDLSGNYGGSHDASPGSLRRSVSLDSASPTKAGVWDWQQGGSVSGSARARDGTDGSRRSVSTDSADADAASQRGSAVRAAA